MRIILCRSAMTWAVSGFRAGIVLYGSAADGASRRLARFDQGRFCQIYNRFQRPMLAGIRRSFILLLFQSARSDGRR